MKVTACLGRLSKAGATTLIPMSPISAPSVPLPWACSTLSACSYPACTHHCIRPLLPSPRAADGCCKTPHAGSSLGAGTTENCQLHTVTSTGRIRAHQSHGGEIHLVGFLQREPSRQSPIPSHFLCLLLEGLQGELDPGPSGLQPRSLLPGQHSANSSLCHARWGSQHRCRVPGLPGARPDPQLVPPLFPGTGGAAAAVSSESRPGRAAAGSQVHRKDDPRTLSACSSDLRSQHQRPGRCGRAGSPLTARWEHAPLRLPGEGKEQGRTESSCCAPAGSWFPLEQGH